MHIRGLTSEISAAHTLSPSASPKAGLQVSQPAVSLNAQQEAAVLQRIQFALQCGASLGVIEDVAILDVREASNGEVVVSGSYKQRVGASFSFMGARTPELVAGVFEAIVGKASLSLAHLFFKVSIRVGESPKECLR